ncbi:MAG: amidohydrolase [Candidatus Obscuribacterales bacterium]|nr:amidohydrolase [Candidatus Obscuribacterales bacterium]
MSTGGFSPAALPAEQTLKDYYESLHRVPELGKEEYKTAEFIRKQLKSFGYDDLLSVEAAPTTVIAVLDTGKPGPVNCFRADMDARKCREKSGVAYASTIDGIMHNCGHDAHSAILLETAKRLLLEKSKLKGKLVFLFQPAEECAGGADDIVNDGVLKRLGVETIIAQHCAPGLEVSRHTLKDGSVLAGSNKLSINLKGKGGHAAQVHERDDLAALASLLTLELERLPSRIADPILYPCICSISTSNWDSEQLNVAPSTISLSGTVRAFFDMDEKLFQGKSFREKIDQLVSGFASAYGVEADVELKAGVPPTKNDPALCARARKILSKSGIELSEAERALFAEDFSFYNKSIPSAYFGLGIARDNAGKENVHSAGFNIHEDCLEEGVKLFVTLAEGLASAKN